MSGPPICVVHIHADGSEEYHIFGAGDVRFLVVDDRCADDRVYRLTVRSPRRDLDVLIGDSPVGDRFEERHPALAARVEALIAGREHLRLVEVPA